MDSPNIDIAPPGSGIVAMASGRGPPCVLIHGALGDYRQWDAIGQRLRPRLRVIALSRRHHWPNDAPVAGVDYSIESHRDDLLAFVRGLPGPLHLVGHSYGALVVLAAALAAPELLGSVTLIEPPLAGLLPPAAAGLDAELASRTQMVTAMRTQILAGDDAAASVTLIDWVQSGQGGFAALAEANRRQLLANAATIGPTYASAPQNVDCAQLRNLRVPTLILNGARSRLFYRLAAQAAASCIPAATAAEIPDAGHMVIVEKPAATAQALLRFLASG